MRGIRLGWKLAVAGTDALALLTSTYLIGISRIQAAIVDFRLKSFPAFLHTVPAANLSDQHLRHRYNKLQSVSELSSPNHIPLAPPLLQTTQTPTSTPPHKRSPSDH